MRLLKASIFKLEHFSNDKFIPDYAILSHTWEEGEEVLFADMGGSIAPGKAAGYKKLHYARRQAIADGLDYVWIDTCCIDKSSSAELSEAINSMYSWYKQASVCYVYMADFPNKVSKLTDCRWFRRGWTLQELIAPSDLRFYSSSWAELGTKIALQDDLAKGTRIDVGILTGEKRLESTSVARRMSWASKRETTRTEDEAYCLMGLFDVNMPMLYGEGSKAFIRLQEEIMKHSDDQSLFVWEDLSAASDSYHGLLAKSPKSFENTGNIVPYRDWNLGAPFFMTNQGLRIDLRLRPLKQDRYIAVLGSSSPVNNEGFVGIRLNRITAGEPQFARVEAQRVVSESDLPENIETVYVRQSPRADALQEIYPLHVFQLRDGPTGKTGYTLVRIIDRPGSYRDIPGIPGPSFLLIVRLFEMRSTVKIPKLAGQLARALEFERHDGRGLYILLGSMADFTIGFDVASSSELKSFNTLQKVFRPQAPGATMGLKHHHVRINAEPRIHRGSKYYMVDIEVKPIYQRPYLSV